MSTTIVLARHGETDWNREHRFQGHADTSLNARGQAQAKELAELFAAESFSTIYASSLRRAAETAEILAARLGLEVRPSDALREVDVGSWSGLTVPEVEARFPDGYRRWIDWRSEGWEDGETYEDLGRRVVAGLRQMGATHPGEQVVAVTHGGPIRCAMSAALGVSLPEVREELAGFGNCSVVRIAVRDGTLERVD